MFTLSVRIITEKGQIFYVLPEVTPGYGVREKVTSYSW
jgi:hypothetical protein